MLEKVKSALLISNVPDFCNSYKALAEDIGVELKTEEEWNARYRVNSDVVILGSKNIENLNKDYYMKAVIILKEGENPFPLIKLGINRFIFNYRNNYELQTAFFREEHVVVRFSDSTYEQILKHSSILNFCEGDYDFKFDKGLFKYKGKEIYLTKASRRYLAEWLLNGNKDNSKRMILCNLRKLLGESFLSDVDRYGNLKEKNNDREK